MFISDFCRARNLSAATERTGAAYPDSVAHTVLDQPGRQSCGRLNLGGSSGDSCATSDSPWRPMSCESPAHLPWYASAQPAPS